MQKGFLCRTVETVKVDQRFGIYIGINIDMYIYIYRERDMIYISHVLERMFFHLSDLVRQNK